jgi:hypothetical protein
MRTLETTLCIKREKEMITTATSSLTLPFFASLYRDFELPLRVWLFAADARQRR